LPAVLDLATIGEMELGEAAKASTSILYQFGLQAGDLRRTLDSLAVAANISTTDVSEMTQAMKFAGPVAATVGMSVQETAAAIALLANAGIRGSLAGTSFRGVLAALIDPSKEAQAAIESMGLTLDQVNPRYHSLSEILKRFRERGLGAAEAITIFQRRQAGAALALTNHVEVFEEFLEKVEESEGAS